MIVKLLKQWTGLFILLNCLFGRILLVPADYSTIQTAIDSVGSGDTVLVSPGNYAESLSTLGKDFTLASHFLTTADTMDINNTVISSAPGQNGIRIENNESAALRIIGFTITKSSSGNYNGILIENANPTLEWLRLNANSENGISMSNSQAHLNHIIIADNQNYGIWIHNYSAPVIANSVIKHNQSSGILIKRSAPLITDTRICGNTANAGGGLFIDSASPHLRNVKITDNQASIGGGVYIYFSDSLRFDHVLIARNISTSTSQSSIGGGGISMYNSDPILNHTVIAHNKAYVWGGGISSYISRPTLINSIVWDNTVTGVVPEIYLASYGELNLAYSNLKGGTSSIQTIYGHTYNILEGNLFNNSSGPDPQWNASYLLQSGSPCIDAGAAFYVLDGDTLVDLDFDQYVGNAPDVGAFEFGTVTPELTADFEAHPPTTGDIPLEVQFIDLSTAPNTTITAWLWNFGDGQSATAQNPLHTYSAPGVYSVSLTISDDYLSDTIVRNDLIVANSPVPQGNHYWVATDGSDASGDGSYEYPYATIMAAMNTVQSGDTITIKNGVYSGSGNVDINFLGKAVVLQSASGPDSCIIDATDFPGVTFNQNEGNGSILRGIQIRKAWNGVYVEGANPIIEDCIFDSCGYGIYSTVNWSTNTPSAPIIRYNLIKNSEYDGIQAYEAGAPFIINNTVANNTEYGIRTGFVDATVKNNIVVSNGYGISQDIPDQGSVILVYNNVWNNTTDYANLTAGEGSLSTDPLFVSTIDYHLQGGSPCIDAAAPQAPLDPDQTRADMGAFYYHQSPETLTAAFSADVTSGATPLLVNFIDMSTGEPESWQWEFGDGTVSSAQHPAHTYTETGTYDVDLTIYKNDQVHTQTLEDYIQVTEPQPIPPQITAFNKLENLPDEPNTTYIDGEFISKDLGYLVTNHNRLFKTTDGGQSWIDISPEPGTSFDGLGVTPRVSFINEDIGAVAFSLDDGGNDYNYEVVFGYVWCTTDGGQTWSQRFDVNEDQITHLQQVNESTLYISGTAKLGVTSTRWFKRILRNPDIGDYTLESVTPTPTSRPHVVSGDWFNQNWGVILARLNVAPWTMEPFLTTNRAASWTSIQGNLPILDNTYYSRSDNGIQFIDENHILLSYYYPLDSGYSSQIWCTNDLGQHWTPANFDDPPSILSSLVMDPVSGIGLAVGGYQEKACYVSQDSGLTWQKNPLPNMPENSYLYGANIAVDGTIWIFGNYRGIWKSTPKLTADFSANVIEGLAPLTVEFTNLSLQGAQPITNYIWHFGDGVSSEETNPVHTYEQPGVYTVSLIVSDDTHSDTLQVQNYITVNLSAQPEILNISDVPQDQGGWVYVRFLRSYFDNNNLITKSSSTDTIEMYTAELNNGSEWVALNSTVAYGDSTYTLLCHTPQDSSSQSDGLYPFRVIAAMNEGKFVSNTSYGYSVDNLAPEVPTNLFAAANGDTSMVLEWLAVTAADLGYYQVYRDTAPNINPQEMNPYAQTTNHFFTDQQIEAGTTYYYWVSAVDHHGNASPLSSAVSIQITTALATDGIVPQSFALGQNYPNPFNPSTTIPYQLPRTAFVTLRIYDYRGALVTILVHQRQAPGYYQVRWLAKNSGGKDMPTGIYFVRLEAEGFQALRKILLMK